MTTERRVRLHDLPLSQVSLKERISCILHWQDTTPVEILFILTNLAWVVCFFLFSIGITAGSYPYTAWLNLANPSSWSMALGFCAVIQLISLLINIQAIRGMACTMTISLYPAMSLAFWHSGRAVGFSFYLIYTVLGIWAVWVMLRNEDAITKRIMG